MARVSDSSDCAGRPSRARESAGTTRRWAFFRQWMESPEPVIAGGRCNRSRSNVDRNPNIRGNFYKSLACKNSRRYNLRSRPDGLRASKLTGGCSLWQTAENRLQRLNTRIQSTMIKESAGPFQIGQPFGRNEVS